MQRGIFFPVRIVVRDMSRLSFPSRTALAAVIACLSCSADAQLRLPTLPNLPTTLPTTPARVLRGVDNALAPADLSDLRRRTIDQLLNRHARELERDPDGEPVVRGELLAEPSSPAARDAIAAAGFTVLREQVLEGLGERWLVLRPAAGQDLRSALAQLRRGDPAGRYDYQHVYTGSGELSTAAAPASAAAPSTPTGGPRVGLIDAGIDRRHPVLRGASLQLHGCDGQAHASPHGTAVASLLVGRGDGFRGAAAGATLYAADVYCDAPAGGSVEAIAQAFAWLAREKVGVINVSLVGPPNQVLERVVAAVLARGHVVVAAVGNDGPAAPPLYPAAWPGVVGVTGTDARRRVLPEAGRGAQVAFAAPGAELAAAASGDERFVPVRGTSFAAPLVAGLLATRLASPEPAAASRAIAALAQEAVDLGAKGRDPIYGWGLVGEALRADPDRLPLAQARR
jgi:subtilisin family serine protease